MKILEVINGITPGTGTRDWIVNSCESMARLGVDCKIVTVNTYGESISGCPIYTALWQLPQDWIPDVVHIHALWSPLLRRAHKWAHERNIPVVVMTHGALSPWARASKRWKKLPYWWLIEKPELKRAAAFHVTAEHEGQWVRDAGFSQPQFLAPLGVGVPAKFDGKKIVDGKRLIVSVGRIYKVKGLDRIVRAVKLLKDAGKWSGWQLVLAGPNWMDYQPELEGIIAECGLQNDVKLPGPVFGDEKDRLYRSASIYIVASYTENFCQPVAEALSYGVPAIASKGCPWQGLEAHGCGVWTENDPENLAKAVETLMKKTDDERLDMGKRGRQWMIDDFSWDSVAKKLLTGFEGVLK